MRLGDTMEAAIWLAGTETPEQRTRYEADVRKAISRASRDSGLIHGPVVFTELKPGDARVPEVPAHITGPDVRLLVAEADAVDHLVVIERSGFVSDLDPIDLERLRLITRRQHERSEPGAARLTDEQADSIIEALGPDAAADAVRDAVNRGALH